MRSEESLCKLCMAVFVTTQYELQRTVMYKALWEPCPKQIQPVRPRSYLVASRRAGCRSGQPNNLLRKACGPLRCAAVLQRKDMSDQNQVWTESKKTFMWSRKKRT